MKFINRYASLVPSGDYELMMIKLYRDPAGTQPTGGDIQIPKEGAILRFLQVTSGVQSWRFHDLTIHPMGSKTDRLNLRWRVTKEEILVMHEEARVKRTYSYTLAVNLDGSYFYLDPQLVDVGDGT